MRLMRYAPWKVTLTGFVAWLCVSTVSCGRQDPGQIAVYPTRGRLQVRGQPAVGAIVILQPSSGGAPDARDPAWSHGFPRGVVRSDGSFRVGTFADEDGATTGNYIVLVQWASPNIAEDIHDLVNENGQSTDSF